MRKIEDPNEVIVVRNKIALLESEGKTLLEYLSRLIDLSRDQKLLHLIFFHIFIYFRHFMRGTHIVSNLAETLHSSTKIKK